MKPRRLTPGLIDGLIPWEDIETMAYVTEDKRVQQIINRLNARKITRERARQEIKALPPQENARCSFLEWEIEEALNQ